MKVSPFVIIIPLAVAAVVVGSVVVVQYFSPVPKESKAAELTGPKSASPDMPGIKAPTGKPEVGFEYIQTTEPVSDLQKTLQESSDSSDADFEDLESSFEAL